jgi:predicted porin
MKKTFALLALLASAAASAQSSVTIFGIVDAYVGYGKGSLSKRTQLLNSGSGSSQLGFRGTEDLGGGMSASFWLEFGVNNDDGRGNPVNVNNQPNTNASLGGAQGLTFNRRSTVSLAGNWGELRLGRDYTPQFYNTNRFDPFANLGSGSSQVASSTVGGVTAVRSSNGIGYFLPRDLGGFYGQAQYYLGENNQTGAATDDDGTGAGVRVGYQQGPVNVALTLSRGKYAAGDVRQDSLGGQLNLNFATLTGYVNRERSGAVSGRGFLAGIMIPVGSHLLRASYSGYKTDAVTRTTNNPQSRKLAIGYVHNLSKRTSLYTTVTRVRNKGGAASAVNGATTAANQPATGFDLGVRHNF